MEISKNYYFSKWEPVKSFYKTYKYTGFMRHNLIYVSIKLALNNF